MRIMGFTVGHFSHMATKILFAFPILFPHSLFSICYLALFFLFFFFISLISYLIIIIFYFPLIAYIILALQIFLNSLLNRKNLAIALFSPFVLFTTHVVYGIMFIKGFWKGMRNKDRIYQ